MRRLAPAQVSPDGGLLQSSTIADRVSYTFAGGDAELVPGSYIEFAERKVLPQFAGLKVGPGWAQGEAPAATKGPPSAACQVATF